MLEKNLEKKLTKACRKNGYKTIKGDSRQNAGFPDRVIYNTDAAFIHHVELKADTNYKQTVLQKYWQKIILQSGGRYFLLNGVKEVDDYIEKYIEKPKKTEEI